MTDMNERRDELLRVLAQTSAELEAARLAQDDEWAQSPFGWLKRLPSRSIGAAGENLVAAWCAALGYTVEPTEDGEADRLIQGRRVEIKMSTRWANGRFKFQQIRDQNYEIMICIALSPRLEDTAIWVIPKAVLMDRPAGVSGQHGGAGAIETLWLDVPAGAPPPWMERWGGDVVRAESVMAELFGS